MPRTPTTGSSAPPSSAPSATPALYAPELAASAISVRPGADWSTRACAAMKTGPSDAPSSASIATVAAFAPPSAYSPNMPSVWVATGTASVARGKRSSSGPVTVTPRTPATPATISSVLTDVFEKPLTSPRNFTMYV